MKYETLAGIAKTAWSMDISVTLEIEGLLFNLTKGRHTVTGLVPWHLLEESRDPHGLCALHDPRLIKPSHWQGTGRAGNGGDI